MNHGNEKASELLAAALHGAADVARAKLERDVTVVEAETPTSTAILRFDLSFPRGGRLSWFVTNEDATGFSDILVGGAGDRGAVLTEMHLDALTVAFSDMLTRAVDTIGTGLDAPLLAGEIDLGMETEMPASDPAGAQVVLALEIAGFGSFPVVQQADAELAHHLDIHSVGAAVPAPAAAAPAAAAAAQPVAAAPEEAPAPAGPDLNAFPSASAPAAASNVVPLQAASGVNSVQEIAQRGQGDLDMLMNVPLPLTVELGSTHRTIRELVDFSIGSIIELGKLAGDPLDIKVNNRVIARGEVVVIDEEFGIRVTEIVQPDDRISGIG